MCKHCGSISTRIGIVLIHTTDLEEDIGTTCDIYKTEFNQRTWMEAVGQLHVSGQLIPSTTPPLSATWRPFTETAMRMREHARNSL